MDEDEDIEDDNQEEILSPEDLASMEERRKFIERYPTIWILDRVLNSHSRLGRLRELDAPEAVIDGELALREKYLTKLAEAFPRDLDVGDYAAEILRVILMEELEVQQVPEEKH